MVSPDSSDPVVAYEAVELQDRVHRALDILSPDMRAAVWLHYVEGLTYQEVSAITDIPAGRLRVLSHRARQQLRLELADEWRPRIERRQTMVEVKLHDLKVMVRPEEAAEPLGQPRAANPRPFLSWVVFLKSMEDDRAFAIWVGPHEGESLAMRMADMAPPRPQTYALMVRLVEGLGAKVRAVTITDLVDDAFLARTTLQVDTRTLDFDCRPSDALNLAQRTDASIFVEESLLERISFEIGADIVESAKARTEALFGTADSEDIEWRSGIDFMREQFERRQEDVQRRREAAEARAREGAQRSG